MTDDKEVNDKQDGESAPNAEPESETAPPSGDDPKVEAGDNKSNGDATDLSKGVEIEVTGSGSKDELKEDKVGESGNDKLEESQAANDAKADGNIPTSEDNTTEPKSGDNGDKANEAGNESSEPISSPPETTVTKFKETDNKADESSEKTSEGAETGGDPNKTVGETSNTIEDPKGKCVVKETEKAVGNFPVEEQNPDTANGTDETTKPDTTEKSETETSVKQEKGVTEPKEQVASSEPTEPNIEETSSADKEKSGIRNDEDENPKMDTENTKLETNEVGDAADPMENTAMEVEIEVVQSSNLNGEPDSVEKTSSIPVSDKAPTKAKVPEVKDDTFEDFQKKPSSKKKKAKKKKKIKIQIPGMSTEMTKTKMANLGATVTPDSPDFALSCHDSLIPEEYDVVEKELEDSLGFFEQPHEDQDPTYTEFIKREQRDRILLDLKNNQLYEESGKKEITAIVNLQFRDRQQSTERNVQKYREKYANDQKNELSRAEQNYASKSRSNKSKIDSTIQLLRKKQAEESQKYMQQHRQQVLQRRVPEQQANAEWAQIAARINQKQSRQMHDLSRRGKEIMNKSKVEYENERTRIKKEYEKRVQTLNTNRQAMHSRLYHSVQQLRARHMKKHLQDVTERRAALKRELASLEDHPTKETANQKPDISPDKAKREEREALRTVSPIKTTTEWREESTHEPSGAASRHNHRKTAMIQIPRQLSVEIHNEGIWLLEVSEKKNSNQNKNSSDNGATTESDKKYFFPWGIKARKILESIACGEIPSTCDDSSKFDFSDTVAQNGGHLRCLVSDLRTSDATASAQRAEAIMKKELNEIKKSEERVAAIQKSTGEMEKSIEIIRKSQHELGLKLKQTLKEYEKTKQHLQAFRTKYSNFFGPDGKPLPTNDPNDTRKLTQHGLKYKMAIESSEKRALAIKQKLAELQASLQKRETNNRTGQKAIASLNATIKAKKHLINEVRVGRLNLLQSKSIDNPSIRVKETISILGVTADMRREQLNKTRNNSNQWVQSLPGISKHLQRSLWYKMHKRRQQIVLRPTFSSMLTNMRKEMESKLKSIDTGIRRGLNEAADEKLMKAEQTYLLVTHPVEQINEKLSPLPSSSQWAEPGWYLKLDVEKDDSIGDRILPCHPRQPLIQYNLSELYSAPGNQTASMISSTHLRSLETPLSAVGTASSLAETDHGMAKSADPILSSNDPLKMTRDALKAGYSFSVTKAPARPTVARRKSSSTKDTATTGTPKGTKKKTVSSSSEVSKSSGASAITARVDNSRKRKSTTQVDHSSAPRQVQRKRTEPPRQNPLDDQAFQPRPIMAQPQQQQQPQQSQAPFLKQTMPQQQQNPYNNQFMNAMPSPVQPQQQANHRGSFNQFQNPQQMNQFRMMQQQQSHHQPQHHHQQQHSQQNVGYGQMQQQPMRPNPQFFTQMGQQQFPQQTMQMPGQGGMQMNLNNPVRPNMGQNMGQDEQNDPLFMLK